MKNKTFALFPCFSISSIYSLDFEKLYQKGYRALLFDIDNTLVLHDEPAREETVALFQRMKAAGFKTAVLSNNGVERVGAFQDSGSGHSQCGKAESEGVLTGGGAVWDSKGAGAFLRRPVVYGYLGRKSCGGSYCTGKAYGEGKVFSYSS